MQIAVIKEQKEGEGRVAATPENVRKMVDAGNEVLVETDAGVGPVLLTKSTLKQVASL